MSASTLLRHLKQWRSTALGLSLGIFAIGGCGKVYNSSSSDLAIYGTGVSGSVNFLNARATMVKRCFSCHANWAGWDEATYVTNSFVTARNLSNSKLYTRIRGNEVNSTGNMPPTGILTTAEVESFSTWILGM